ncbi:MAG: nicotinate (nicotinamide) nucleotide adenylyltransferase [Muribaculum sp.]|nr:nicotinate (nicotinamide) nucleotide adenylyltransferase [Muribaculaceae bacterium]MCM1081695.1 nicotinate (nicotinamide) nucleotide adenylyltransferase [Muribaculum sp.]
MRQKIGIFGGSFNPVHIGHLMLASWIAQSGLVDRVWLMLSPANPLKSDSSLVEDNQRREMLEIALADSKLIELCTLELELPRPSYTINTLSELNRRYPQFDFTLIVGSDNLEIFDKWRSHEELLSRYGLIVYPRPGYPIQDVLPTGVTTVDAPLLEISSTEIRRKLACGWDMNFFMPSGVYNYIKENKLYY